MENLLLTTGRRVIPEYRVRHLVGDMYSFLKPRLGQ